MQSKMGLIEAIASQIICIHFNKVKSGDRILLQETLDKQTFSHHPHQYTTPPSHK
jgi:hypothetical protein